VALAEKILKKKIMANKKTLFDPEGEVHSLRIPPPIPNGDGVAELIWMLWRRKKLLDWSVNRISVLKICCPYKRQIK